jgi:hypothetical protein
LVERGPWASIAATKASTATLAPVDTTLANIAGFA